MADTSFFTKEGPFPLKELAQVSGATVQNREFAELMIHDVSPLDQAGPGEISFLSNPKYLEEFKLTEASACIVAPKQVSYAPEGLAVLAAEDPYKAYAKIAQHFYPLEKATGEIHPTAIVSPTAKIGDNVSIGAYSTIGDDARIGRGTVIKSHVTIEKGVKLGRECLIYPQVSLQACHIGDRVTLHSGARIGCDGFGFAPDPTGHVKIPQLGRVLIGSDVEIGANSAIDRGAGPDTIIGDGCWIDNLCQIAHNVQLGRGCILAAQTGVSGSSILDDFVVVGGQVGIAGHIRIGMGTQISAKSGVISDIPPGQIYAGFPARPRKEFFRSMAILGRLSKGRGKKE